MLAKIIGCGGNRKSECCYFGAMDDARIGQVGEIIREEKYGRKGHYVIRFSDGVESCFDEDWIRVEVREGDIVETPDHGAGEVLSVAQDGTVLVDTLDDGQYYYPLGGVFARGSRRKKGNMGTDVGVIRALEDKIRRLENECQRVKEPGRIRRFINRYGKRLLIAGLVAAGLAGSSLVTQIVMRPKPVIKRWY